MTIFLWRIQAVSTVYILVLNRVLNQAYELRVTQDKIPNNTQGINSRYRNQTITTVTDYV